MASKRVLPGTPLFYTFPSHSRIRSGALAFDPSHMTIGSSSGLDTPDRIEKL